MVTQGLISTREDILERAIPLFARLGFHGVSMRDIAAEVEMQAAALYHHFADKEALYLAAMAYAFKDKSVVLTQAIAIPGTPLERLNRFVETLAEGMGRDPDFLALLQRERIDGNETRLKLLAEEVFAEPFDALLTLAKEIALITARPRTTASLLWEVAEEWELWGAYQTPDLKEIVQEIVDRSGWEVMEEPKSDKKAKVERRKQSDNGLDKHMENFVSVIRSRKMQELACPIEEASHIAVLSQMGNIAFRSGKKLDWDLQKGRFTDESVNKKYLTAPYNNGYKLPVIG